MIGCFLFILLCFTINNLAGGGTWGAVGVFVFLLLYSCFVWSTIDGKSTEKEAKVVPKRKSKKGIMEEAWDEFNDIPVYDAKLFKENFWQKGDILPGGFIDDEWLDEGPFKTRK